MTATQAANYTEIPHDAFLAALRGGRVSGKKYRGRWRIKPRDAWRLKTVNDAKVAALREEYISLYWQGRSVAWLQAHVAEDFAARHIVWETKGFAEKTIYSSEMNDRRNHHANLYPLPPPADGGTGDLPGVLPGADGKDGQYGQREADRGAAVLWHTKRR